MLKNHLLLFAFITVARATIICYDCDPKLDPDKCDDPEKSQAIERKCEAEDGKFPICTTTYLQGDVLPEGIYRGCELVTIFNKERICKIMEEKAALQNITLDFCEYCSEDLCNKGQVQFTTTTTMATIDTVKCFECQLDSCKLPESQQTTKQCARSTDGVSPECGTWYIQNPDDASNSGIYKGCHWKNDEDRVVFGKKLDENLVIKSSHFCSTDLCNTDSDNIGNQIYSSFITFVISVLFVLCVVF